MGFEMRMRRKGLLCLSERRCMYPQKSPYTVVAPRGFGIWGEWLIIFRGLGSTGNYFRGAREQAHNFADLGSLARKAKIKKGKASILFDFLIFSSASGGGGGAQTPLVTSKCIRFRTSMLI